MPDEFQISIYERSLKNKPHRKGVIFKTLGKYLKRYENRNPSLHTMYVIY